MISTSDECYRHFLEAKGLDADGDPDLVGLFAFALVERERIGWIDHRIAHDRGEPTGAEIQDWYSQKPDSSFDEKLKAAVSRFDLYARGYLADDLDSAREAGAMEAFGAIPAEVEASRIAILAAITAAKDTSRHWWRGGFQGAFGNLIFAVLVALLLWVLAHQIDVLAWLRAQFGV